MAGTRKSAYNSILTLTFPLSRRCFLFVHKDPLRRPEFITSIWKTLNSNTFRSYICERYEDTYKRVYIACIFRILSYEYVRILKEYKQP